MRSLSPGINAGHDERIAEIGIVTRFSSRFCAQSGANVPPSRVNRAFATDGRGATTRASLAVGIIVKDLSKGNARACARAHAPNCESSSSR